MTGKETHETTGFTASSVFLSLLKGVGLIIVSLTLLVFVIWLLYIIKSALGINFFEERHLSDFLPFSSIPSRGVPT